MAGAATRRVQTGITRILKLTGKNPLPMTPPSDITFVDPRTTRPQSCHGVLLHLDSAASHEGLFHLGDHYVDTLIRPHGLAKPVLMYGKTDFTTTMPREFPGATTVLGLPPSKTWKSFFEQARSFAAETPVSHPFLEREVEAEWVRGIKPDVNTVTVRQSYTQTTEGAGIQGFLDFLKSNEIRLRSGVIAETAGSFKTNFTARTGLPFTPENFRQHLVHELGASGTCIFYYDGNTMSRFFDAGVVMALQEKGLKIQVFVVTSREDIPIPPIFHKMQNLTMVEGFEESHGRARALLQDELSYLKTRDVVLGRS